jgi:Outer membrane receptor proteins, mostly Fe transport
VWFSADHKVFGDQMVVYADGFYQRVNTHNELAAPATVRSKQRVRPYWLFRRIRRLRQARNHPTPHSCGDRFPADAFNPFNPFEQIISGGTRARLAEFGNRLFDNETDAWLSTIGIKGDKLFDGSWGYDAGFRYSQLDNTQTGTQVSASRFNRILNQADPIFDPRLRNSSARLSRLIRLVIFASSPVQFGHGRVRQSAPQGRGHLKVGHVRCHHLHNRPLSPAGWRRWLSRRWSMAAGATERESRYAQFGGRHRWQLASSRCSGQPKFLCDLRRDQNSYLQPRDEYLLHRRRQKSKKSAIVSETHAAIPGFYSLEFTAGGRFEEFLNNDSNVLVPKVGMRWQPFDEQLTLRATWGEGFREPSLEELFGSPVSTLEVTHDPLKGGLLESETNTLITSNPNLQPEDSRSFSGGFVYSPKYAPGLNISVDFWDIERTGVVTAPLAQQVLDGTAPGIVERDAGGFITRITLANENLGSQEARGFDFGLYYQRPTQWGTFTSQTQVTYLDEFLFPQFIFAEFGTNSRQPGRQNHGPRSLE